ncbi:hypothetical protein BV20DRAFT_974856 [Pilatotrama ljubarskyi]|nr:hypothetical protein BV20DRAFT_974856 [Pilatotrama ljubarskyi]
MNCTLHHHHRAGLSGDPGAAAAAPARLRPSSSPPQRLWLLLLRGGYGPPGCVGCPTEPVSALPFSGSGVGARPVEIPRLRHRRPIARGASRQEERGIPMGRNRSIGAYSTSGC